MRCRPLDGVFSAPSKPLYPRLPDARGTTLSRVLGAYAAAGANLWFADLTRPVPGVPVFRALSTILCHGRPRFARPRLLAADGVDDDRPRRATTFPLLAI